MSKPRISYVDPATVKDQAIAGEFDRCRREGTPRPESQAIRAHVPAVFWSFANPGATCSSTASPTTRSRSCAASTCRARQVRILRQPALHEGGKARALWKMTIAT